MEQNAPNNKRPIDGDGPTPCGAGTPLKCTYTAYSGAIASYVGNVAGPLNLTTPQAEAKCSKSTTCAGFTYEGQQTACATTACKTYLKTNADWTASNTDPTWNTYTKYPRAARPQGAKYGSQGLIMGNGAESRKTFHYFAPGYERDTLLLMPHPLCFSFLFFSFLIIIVYLFFWGGSVNTLMVGSPPTPIQKGQRTPSSVLASSVASYLACADMWLHVPMTQWHL